MTYIPPNWNGSVQQSQNYCFPGLIVLCMSPFSHRADVLFQLSRIFGITGRLLHHGQVRRTSLRSRELTFPYPDPRRSLEMLSRACVNGLALPHDEVWPEAIFMGIRFKNFHANQARFSSRASSDSLETGLPAVFVMLSTKNDFGQEASQKCGAERKEDSNGKVWGASSKAPLVVGNGLLQCQGQQRDSYVGRTHVSEEKSSVIALDFYQRASGIKKSRLIYFFFFWHPPGNQSFTFFCQLDRTFVIHLFVGWLSFFFYLLVAVWWWSRLRITCSTRRSTKTSSRSRCWPGTGSGCPTWWLTTARSGRISTSSTTRVRPGTHAVTCACVHVERDALFFYGVAGTYNNQYMILDLKRVDLKKTLQDGALWVVEQIPGWAFFHSKVSTFFQIFKEKR